MKSFRARITLPLAILFLFAAYAGYWFWLAGRLQAGVEESVAGARTQGYRIAHGSIMRAGFPFRVEVQLAQPVIGQVREGLAWRWQADGLAVAMPMYRYDELTYRALGGARLSYGAVKPGAANGTLERQTVLAPAESEVRVRYDEVGIRSLDLDWAGIAIAQEGATPVQLAKLSLRERATQGNGGRGPGLFVSVRADGMQVPGLVGTPLGPRIGLLEAQATVEGPITDAPLKQALLHWRDAGGVLDLPQFQIVWGSVRVTGSGALALDEAARPMGTFSLRIAGYNWLIDQFVSSGKMNPSYGDLARSALAALAQEKGNQDGVPVAIRIQDGRVFLGPVRVAKVEPLF